MIARSVANFSSNRLKTLGTTLHLQHQKMEKGDGWPQWWFKAMQGDMAAVAAMAEYCKDDVRALEELYYRLLPFDNAHPRMYADRATCGKCGAQVQYRGKAVTKNSQYKRWQCANGHWGKDDKQIKA